MASPRPPQLTTMHGGSLPDPDPTPEVPAIREELDRVLASAAFRASKRCSSLLKHIVERTIDGRADELKERTIGVELFGRADDYDTSSDHIVRSVAAEVRRRLTQYLAETPGGRPVRIELQAGSYVPQFRGAGPAPEPVAPSDVRRPFAWRWIALAVLMLGLAVGGLYVVRPETPIQRFWAPLVDASSPVLLCVGGPNPAHEDALTGSVVEFDMQPSRSMHTSDALTLAAVAAHLESRHKPYRIWNRANATSYKDLQSGPFVLIGGMNNEWTLRVTGGLRFGFDRAPGGARVVDRQNPSGYQWTVDVSTPVAQFTRDYAIVSRLRDPRTEQSALIVAGIGSWGTLAAGEFVTNPDHLKKLAAIAPANWDQKNMQVVIATDIIRASSGPPQIVATHFW